MDSASLVLHIMEKKKISLKNTLFLIVVLLLVVPQTRLPIQVLLHKGLALFGPSIENVNDVEQISSYDWKLQDAKGNVINFEASKHRVTLVNLWATWCPPCIAEMPSMEALYGDYKDKMDFVFVSNEDREVISKFLKREEYTFQVYSSISKAPETFNVQSIPRTFLIDRNGNVIIDKSGAANWNAKTVRATIDELLIL